jgi:ribonuclease HI
MFQSTTLKRLTHRHHTSLEALEVCLGILPTQLRILHKATNRWIDLHALPRTYAIHHTLRNNHKGTLYATKVASAHPLSWMAAQWPQLHSTVSNVYVLSEWWQPWIETVPPSCMLLFAQSKDTGISDLMTQLHDHPADSWTHVYTDGSASALTAGFGVHFADNTLPNTAFGLGWGNGIAEAEALALLFALEHASPSKNILLLTDSKSTLERLVSHRPHAQPCYMHQLRTRLHRLHSANCHVHLMWIPGHRDIPGNETADLLANTARTQQPPTDWQAWKQHTSTATLKQYALPLIVQSWMQRWSESSLSAHTKTFIHLPSLTFPSLLLSRLPSHSHIIAILKLWTGDFFLATNRSHLHIDVSPLCPCGSGVPETLVHFLYHCPTYSLERLDLQQAVRPAIYRNLHHLLLHPTSLPVVADYVIACTSCYCALLWN